MDAKEMQNIIDDANKNIAKIKADLLKETLNLMSVNQIKPEIITLENKVPMPRTMRVPVFWIIIGVGFHFSILMGGITESFVGFFISMIISVGIGLFVFRSLTLKYDEAMSAYQSMNNVQVEKEIDNADVRKYRHEVNVLIQDSY